MPYIDPLLNSALPYDRQQAAPATPRTTLEGLALTPAGCASGREDGPAPGSRAHRPSVEGGAVLFAHRVGQADLAEDLALPREAGTNGQRPQGPRAQAGVAPVHDL